MGQHAEEGGAGWRVPKPTRGGFNHNGAGPVLPDVKRGCDQLVQTIPGISLSRRICVKNGAAISGLLDLSWHHDLIGTNREISAAFKSTPAGTPAFTVTGNEDTDTAQVDAGISVHLHCGANVLLDYEGACSQHGVSNGGMLAVNVAFNQKGTAGLGGASPPVPDSKRPPGLRRGFMRRLGPG